MIIDEKTAAVIACESAWEPTPDELTLLINGGQVVLRVYGWQIPVSLYVEPPAIDEEGSSGLPTFRSG